MDVTNYLFRRWINGRKLLAGLGRYKFIVDQETRFNLRRIDTPRDNHCGDTSCLFVAVFVVVVVVVGFTQVCFLKK